MRRLYTLLVGLALPVATLAVAWRGLRHRAYWQGWAGRFGATPSVRAGGLWVHAVSVGEVQAAALLIGALRARAPDLPICLTCATPTGRERARALLPQVPVGYAPYDLPGLVQRRLARTRPRLLVILETELWPNLLHGAARAGVPTLIASARVSLRTARWYRRFPGLLGGAFARNVWVGAQSAADAERFIGLGVPAGRVSVTGNVKFDREPDPHALERARGLRARYGAQRPVWIAGSTHEHEEQRVLEAHRHVQQRLPDALLILAPRHPQRFEAAAATVAAAGLRSARRSTDRSAGDPAGRQAGSEIDVLLLDTLGELPDFYGAADVAFVGGSLVPVGGHNLLEPAALGRPVLSGPYQFNSPDIARRLASEGALTIVRGAGELADMLCRLLPDQGLRERHGALARRAVEVNRGALLRVLEQIEMLLRQAPVGGVNTSATPDRPPEPRRQSLP